MAEISASMVKELREKSGAAMMDCKKALVETQGNFEKAFEWLRQKGIAVASKKASRTASEGIVVGNVSTDGKTGVIIELNCETDYVARNEEFIALGKAIVETALKTGASNIEFLMKQKYDQGTLADLVTDKVAKIKENIVVRRISFMELSGCGVIGLYIHALGSKMGALVKLGSDKEVTKQDLQTLSRELAMHIVSSKPHFLSLNEVPQSQIENERRIESGKADLADKKPEMREKIVSGRVNKLLSERCLLDQPFVKDPTTTVAQYLKQKGSTAGTELQVIQFALFILGDTAGEAPDSNNN